MLNKVKNKGIFILLDQAIVSGANFILGILLAKELGIDIYGQFVLLWLLVLFFNSLQLACIVSPMLTFGSKQNSQGITRYLRVMLEFQIIFSILVIILMYILFEIIAYYNDRSEIENLRVYLIIVVALSLHQDFLRRYFIIRLNYYKLLTLDIIAHAGQLLIVSLYIHTKELSLENIFLSISASLFVSILYGSSSIKLAYIKKKYRFLIFIRSIEFSKWLVYSSILQWGSGNFYVLSAGYFLGDWAIGVIRVMQNTMGIFNIFFLSFENIFPIIFSRIKKRRGNEKLRNYYKKYILVSFFVSIIIAYFIYIYSMDVIEYIYGYKYSSYSYLMIYFVLIYLGIFISLVLRVYFRTVELTKYIFNANICALGFNLIASYPIINYFQINGVVAGIILSHLVYASYLYYNAGKIILK